MRNKITDEYITVKPLHHVILRSLGSLPRNEPATKNLLAPICHCRAQRVVPRSPGVRSGVRGDPGVRSGDPGLRSLPRARAPSPRLIVQDLHRPLNPFVTLRGVVRRSPTAQDRAVLAQTRAGRHPPPAPGCIRIPPGQTPLDRNNPPTASRSAWLHRCCR